MPLSLTVGPTLEPVSINDAKEQLSITHTSKDSHIKTFVIPTARQLVEEFLCRAVMQQTYALTLSGFGGRRILLPRPPLSSVTSVTYIDTGGASQTWDASKYTEVKPTGPRALHGWIEPAHGEDYPATRLIAEAVTITFVAGYGTQFGDVPTAIHLGLLMTIEDLYFGQDGAVKSVLSARDVLTPWRAARDDLRLD